MKNKMLLFMTIGMILMVALSINLYADNCGCCSQGACSSEGGGCQKQSEDKSMTMNKQNVEAKNVGNKICPVMNAPVAETGQFTVEYEGKIYNLCCPACIAEFKKDPAKYIKIVEEELNQQKK